VVHVHNFSYGLLTPLLGYAMSSLGCFLGLRCTTRARAYSGAARVRWLALAGVSIGTTGIWVMHFIAMLGFTIGRQTIRYSVTMTVLSMLIAVAVVSVGLFIVGFGGDRASPLLFGGTVIGCGVGSMHYMGMAAMRMPDTVRYDPLLLVLSLAIAVIAGTAALWAALRLSAVRSTLTASLIMGIAVSGMHYTGMAAMQVHGIQDPAMASSMQGGASAEAFLPGLIIGISILAFIVTAIVSLAPTAEEIREDATLTEWAALRFPDS